MTDETHEHEEAPVDEAALGLPVGEGNVLSLGENRSDEEPETFPRAYVQKLREESAKHRTRAGDRDDLAQRLHTALTAATGRLADPTDLAFDDAHLADPDALSAAVDDLLARKPHLASRRPVGDVGQGATKTGETINLAGMLRALAL